MFRCFIFVVTTYGTVVGQIADSTSTSKVYKSPAKAATWAFLAPGGGQFYNGQKLKGTALLSGALVCGLLYFDNSKKYDDYSGVDSAEKSKLLKLRNKYGWWVGFVYIYGLLDAIVEAHLHPFNEIMNEDLEKPKSEDNKE